MNELLDRNSREQPYRRKVLVPATLAPGNGDVRVRWLRATPDDLRLDPFFSDTVSRFFDRSVERSVVETELADLVRWGSRNACSPPPRGFLFHVSRCGSTLAAKVLGEVERAVVFREPLLLADLLTRMARLPEKERYAQALRASMSAFGRMAHKGSPYFIKFPSGVIFSVDSIRRLFPSVREVFMYRAPVEVMVSNLQDPWQGWLWDETITGVPLAQAVERSVTELVARAIGKKMSAMLSAYRDDQCLLLNHSELDLGSTTRLLRFFDIAPNAALTSRIERILSLDAKHEGASRRFEPDTVAKRLAASEYLKALANRFAEPQYQALESLRRKQQGL